MGIVEEVRQIIVDFVVLYKLELLALAGIIMVILYIVTQVNKLNGATKNEL